MYHLKIQAMLLHFFADTLILPGLLFKITFNSFKVSVNFCKKHKVQKFPHNYKIKENEKNQALAGEVPCLIPSEIYIEYKIR